MPGMESERVTGIKSESLPAFIGIRSHTNKRFCGRRCSKLQTSAESQNARRTKERQEKIKRVKRQIREFAQPLSGETDWRGWVCSKAGVHRKFLTRALNNGSLKLTEGQRQLFNRLDLQARGRAEGAMGGRPSPGL